MNSNAYNFTTRFTISKNTQNKAPKKYKGYKIETLGHSQGGLLTHKLGTNSLSSIHLNPAYKGESQRQNHNITIPAKTSNPLTEHSIEI